MKQVEILLWTLKCNQLPPEPDDKKCWSVVTGAGGENESSVDPPSALTFLPLCYFYLLAPSPPVSSQLARSLVLVWQRDEDVHIVEGEEPRLAAQHALVPVLVDLIGQGYDVALAEAQLALVLRIEVVERLTARLLRC